MALNRSHPYAMVSGRAHSGNFVKMRRKKAWFCGKNAVFYPLKRVFLDCFWTVFDGPFSDPGRPAAAGARRRAAADFDLSVSEIILLKPKGQYRWRYAGRAAGNRQNCGKFRGFVQPEQCPLKCIG